MERRYCVYTHKRKDNGVVFYLGHGTLARPKRKGIGKTLKWVDVDKEAGGHTVEILKDKLTKQEAIDLENNYLIEQPEDWKLINVNKNQVVQDINYDIVSRYFEYSDRSPSGLIWKESSSRKNIKGGIAGNMFKRDQYWRVGLHWKIYRVHRIIAVLLYGDLSPDMVVNHIDGDPSNNNKENLEVITQQENSRRSYLQTTDKLRPDNTSGYTGICETRIGSTNYSAMFRWIDSDGKPRVKKFAYKKHGGKELAYLAANNFKLELNLQGAGYTERHGT